MAERTFPTAGKSPCDHYLAPTYVSGEVGLPAGYFEVVAGGYRAASCVALYAKVDTGSGLPSVSGRVSVIEGRLDVPDTASTLSTMSVLCLDFENLNTATSIHNVAASYILLRDRVAQTLTGQQMPTLFDFADITLASVETDDPNVLISTSVVAMTHSIKCRVKGVNLWLMATSNVPSGGA